MQVIGRAVLVAAEIADLADELAGLDGAAAEHSGRVEQPWPHVQVAEAHVLVRGVDHEPHGFLPGRAQNRAVAHRDHVVLVLGAAVVAEARAVAVAGADVLALVAHAARAPRQIERAAFAEIVAPRIGVDAAGDAVRIVLRVGEGGRLGEREADVGIDGRVGAAVVAAIAGVGREVAGRVIREGRRQRGGAIERRRRGGRRLGGLRRAADDAQLGKKELDHPVGVAAGHVVIARDRGVEAVGRDHVGHAVAHEGVAHIVLDQAAADAGEIGLEGRNRGALVGERRRNVVDQPRAGDRDVGGAVEMDVGERRNAGERETERGVVARRAGIEEGWMAEAEEARLVGIAGLVAARLAARVHRVGDRVQRDGARRRSGRRRRRRRRGAVLCELRRPGLGAVAQVGVDVERQQHRDRAARNAGQARRHRGIELIERRATRGLVDRGADRERDRDGAEIAVGARPVDGDAADARRLHLAGHGRAKRTHE